jgi:predicted MFS family arabinose efflux permease
MSAAPRPGSSPQASPSNPRNEWLRAAPLLAACMVSSALPIAAIYSLGQFMAPLERAFGWSRSESSSGLTFGLVVGLVLAPFVGRLIDRVNVRAIAIPGIVASALALASFSFADGNPAQWLGLWALNVAIGSMIAPTLWLAAAGAAVSTHRNLALGLALCGTAVAAAVAPPLARALLNAYSWRTAYQLLALVWGSAALLLTVLFFFDHRPRGAAAAAAGSAKGAAGGARRASLRELFFTASFAKLAVVVFATMTVIAAYMIHLAPALVDGGLDRNKAAGIAGVAGLTAIAGKLCIGWLFDRAPLRVVGAGVMACLGLASVLLAMANGQPMLATLGAMAIGFTGGAMLTVTACVSAQQFDPSDFGLVYGVLASITGVGGALGPLLASYLHDKVGSYAPGFWAGLVVAAGSALVLSTLRSETTAGSNAPPAAQPAGE